MEENRNGGKKWTKYVNKKCERWTKTKTTTVAMDENENCVRQRKIKTVTKTLEENGDGDGRRKRRQKRQSTVDKYKNCKGLLWTKTVNGR